MITKSSLKYIISGFILAVIMTQVDFKVLVHETSHSDLKLIFLATIAIIGQIIFLNFRWHELLNAGKDDISFTNSLLINLIGYFANILFITSIGGIIAKSGLAIKHGIGLVHSLFATFLDRFMTLFALLALTAISLPFLAGVLDLTIVRMLSITIMSVTAIIAVGGLMLKSKPIKSYIVGNRKRAGIAITFRQFVKNPGLMIRTGLYSIIAQLFFILSIYMLSFGFEFEGSKIEFIALIPALALISSLPISFGGWGVREGAFIYGLGLIGFSVESAFLLSIQVGIVTMIAPLLVAIPYIVSNDFQTFSKRILNPSLGPDAKA